MSAPVIFSGAFAKFLKSNLNLQDQAYLLTGTANPTSVAQLAPPSSLYLQATAATTSSFSNTNSNGYGEATVGQYGALVIPTATGPITGGTFYVSYAGTLPSGNLTMKIYVWENGSQSILVATSTAVALSSITNGTTPTAVNFTFSGSVVLQSGVQYAVVLDGTGATSSGGLYIGYASSGTYLGVWNNNTTYPQGFLVTSPFNYWAFSLTQSASGAGNVYVKQDSGTTTNWTLIASNPQIEVANAFEERFHDQLIDSPYDLMTTNVFGRDGYAPIQTLGGTASVSQATGLLSFASIGDSFISAAQLDSSEFSNDTTGLRDVASVDLTTFWNITDVNSVQQVSRDGGVHFQTVTMKRIGNSTNAMVGTYSWTTEDQDTITDSYTNQSVTQPLNAGSDYLSQPFYSAYSMTVTNVGLYLLKTGTPVGNYQIAIVPMDVNGNPVPTNPIWVSGYQATSGLTTSAALVSFTVSNVVIPGGKYYIMIQTDSTYKAGYTSSGGSNSISVAQSVTQTNNPSISQNLSTLVWSPATRTSLYSVTYTRDTSQTIADYTVNGVGGAQGLNATTIQAIGQQFALVTTNIIKAVTINVESTNASLAGNIYVQIVNDSGGVPSTALTDVVAQSNAIPVAQFISVNGTANTTQFDVAVPKTVLKSGSYWVVIKGDATFQASVTSLGATLQVTTVPTGSNTPTYFRQYNGTGWGNGSTTSQALDIRVLGRPLDLRVKITSSVAGTSLAAWSVFYDLQGLGIVGIPLKSQRFVFPSQGDGVSTGNLNTFALNFTADPNLLTCYVGGTGQVFKAINGDFVLQGNSAVFPANTFNNAGQTSTVYLTFDQNTGGAFDTSDINGNIISQNHLGSPVGGNYDKSVAGRGIYMRNAAGTLREVALDANDNLIILSTP